MAEVARLEAELAQIRTGLQDTVKKMKNFGAGGDDEMIVRRVVGRICFRVSHAFLLLLRMCMCGSFLYVYLSNCSRMMFLVVLCLVLCALLSLCLSFGSALRPIHLIHPHLYSCDHLHPL